MIKAQSTDRSSVTSMLTQSFDNNKSVNYIIPQDRHRTKRTLRLILRCVGLANLRKVLQREAIIKKLHPREEFCYLWFIGVAPAAQQKSIGSRLLRELLDQCDQEGLPVYLETSVEKNVPWYERAGFTIYDKLNLGYTLYCMKRGARLYAD